MNPNPHFLRWRKILVFFGTALIIASALLFIFPVTFLRISHVPTPCDAIVILGGGPTEREPVTADLYRRGFAKTVIITGEGDCLGNYQALAERGVPTNAMVVECDSLSTKENAEAVSVITHKLGITNILLVTTWHHSRRAVCTFHKFAPGLKVSSSVADVHSPLRYELRHVAAEYVKILWYAFRWRVPPWT